MTEKEEEEEEEEEDYTIINICQLCQKNIESDKVRDHCHLTVKYRGPAHSICNINVTQKQSNFFYHLSFIILVTMIVICFLKK